MDHGKQDRTRKEGVEPRHAARESKDGPLPVHGLSHDTMEQMPFSITVADAVQPDRPLVYVNRAFEQLTGYARGAVLGHNCRFLQGDDTSEADCQAMRQALAEQREATVDIINYRANGERFLNRVHLKPLASPGAPVSHILGVQTEVPDDRACERKLERLDHALREVQHRIKNHLAMLLALIRLESRRTDAGRTCLQALAQRVETLNLLYDELSLRNVDMASTVDLGVYVTRIASALKMLDGQHELILNIGPATLKAPVELASQIGLLVSELLTNALRHAFDEGGPGQVEVNLWTDEALVWIQVCDTGRGLAAGCEWPRKGNLGARIARDLSQRLDAELIVSSSPNGTHVTVKIPRSLFESDCTGQF